MKVRVKFSPFVLSAGICTERLYWRQNTGREARRKY